MPNYTKTEIEAFHRKDLLNSRMSAVKAASVNFEARGVSFADFKLFADQVFSWVQQDQLNTSSMPKVRGEVEVKSGVLPTPTADQKKVLDAISIKLDGLDDKHDFYTLQEKVLWFSTEVAKVDKPTYPNNMTSVDRVAEWIHNS